MIHLLNRTGIRKSARNNETISFTYFELFTSFRTEFCETGIYIGMAVGCFFVGVTLVLTVLLVVCLVRRRWENINAGNQTE